MLKHSSFFFLLFTVYGYIGLIQELDEDTNYGFSFEFGIRIQAAVSYLVREGFQLAPRV